MTTSTKLWLGFGFLTVFLVLSSVLTILRFQWLQSSTYETVNDDRTRRIQTTQLRVSVLGYGLAVRSYMQSGDISFFREAGEKVADVDRLFAEYRSLARTERQRQMAERFQVLWQTYKERGQAILNSQDPPPTREDYLRLAQDRVAVDKFLTDEVVADAIAAYDSSRSEWLRGFSEVLRSGFLFILLGIVVSGVTALVVRRGIVKNEREVRGGRERLRVTLASIGDAVITADAAGRITFLNAVAESLTGWTHVDAMGKPLSEVFRVVNEETREPVEIPTERAIRDGVVVGLANHTILIAKDGIERPIDDSAAPIREADGSVGGVILVFRDIAERKHAEEVEAHLASIVTSSSDAIISKDLHGIITSWNDGAQRLFGYTAEEAIGRPVTMLIPTDHLDEEPRIFDRIKRGERIDIYETVRKRKDGTRVDVSLSVSPIRNAAGRIIGASKFAREITEQKRAAQSLRESHARFETLFNDSPIGMILIDNELRIRLVNPAARPALGEIPGLIGREFKEVVEIIFFPEMAGELVARFRHTLETGEPYSVPEFCADRRDRPEREYYDWQIHRIALPEGGHGLVCYFFDITARVLGKQAVHDAAIRYSRLFESAHDGILIVDLDSRKVVDANAYMSAIVGIEQKDLIGKELFEIGVPRGVEASEEFFRELHRVGHFRKEMPIETARDENVDVEIVANAYHEGRQLMAQFNVRDISERSELLKKISEQAEVLAGESRRKDEFLAMLSHELRNPLAPIRSAVYLLKMHGHETENVIQQQAREIIERQVGTLTKLISDLLDVSRVISGRIRLNRQTMDLSQAVNHAVQTLAPLIERRRHEVIVSCPTGAVWTNADATRIEEIVVNLLSNAAKYTDEGGRIDVLCEYAKSDDYVEVRVRDNGIGIEPDLLPHIFDLFTQSDRTLARSDGGLGIGLNLVHRLVELHGGTIEAHSPPEGQYRGSEFILRLPAAPAPDRPSLPAGSADTGRMAGGRRVLVVDDNLDQVSMLASGLRAKGYTVQSANTGPDGLKAALQWKPDIALLDIGLPGLNGYEVARRVRAAQAREGTKITLIALTGYGRDTDIALAREAGFDRHLTKPCDFEELEKLLRPV